MKGLTLAVVFAYFSTGDNAHAANQVNMAQIFDFTHSNRVPFVIAADFNMEPDRLWEIGWVQSFGCAAGRGRIIGFVLISDSVQPFWR